MCSFRTFSRASLLDQGEKFDVEGLGVHVEVNDSCSGCAEVLITPVRLKRYDLTTTIFNPTSLCSRDCKLTTMGVHEMGALAHASIFVVTIPCPEYRCHETPGIPHARDPMPLLPYQTGRKKNLLYKLTWNLHENLWKGLALATLP